MADTNWLQGTLPPESTSTQTKTTEFPQFYTDYLQNLATAGKSAIEGGGIAGLSPLQQASFAAAPSLAFSGANTVEQAANLANQGGGTALSGIQQYMNPYTQNVVNEMARLQQQAIQQNVLPSMRGQFAGTGGFGSQRQANATGQTLAEMQANLLGAQQGALERGWNTALGASQADLNRAIQASDASSRAAQIQSAIGTGGLNTLQNFGKAQQAQEQAILDYPMQALQKYSQLMQPFAGAMPSTSYQQTTGIQPNTQYGLSPASQLGGLLTGLGALLAGGGGGAGTTGGTDTSGGLFTEIGTFLKKYLSGSP